MVDWHIELGSSDDWAGFREAARLLLAHDMASDHITWTWSMPAPCGSEQTALFAPALQGRHTMTPSDLPLHLSPTSSPSRSLRLSPQVLETCAATSLHADSGRFELIYRWLRRLYRGEVAVSDSLDSDWRRIAAMARAVNKEMHKMQAFVRFRPLQRDNGAPDLHMAWFEPVHHIARVNAGFFVRRFTNMHWTILTPELGVHWDTCALSECPGSLRDTVPPPDAGEQLWLAYYRSTFNPARLKRTAMLKEMPRRYWKNMPETQLIDLLSMEAHRLK